MHPGGGTGALSALPCGQHSACLPKIGGSLGGKGRDERHTWLPSIGSAETKLPEGSFLCSALP